MEPITEARLRRATERAVAGGHAIGALLFGSRARGTAGALSDWDVCLVTSEDPGSVEAIVERERALEADDTFWDNGHIERLWVHRARFDRGVPIGTIEAAIAREGRALAGDASMAKKARTVPFEAETVVRNMNRATVHLRVAIAGAPRAGTGDQHGAASGRSGDPRHLEHRGRRGAWPGALRADGNGAHGRSSRGKERAADRRPRRRAEPRHWRAR